MGLAGTHVERDERLENGRRIFTDTIHIKPIAFERGGSLRRITSLLGNSGDPNLPIGCDELLQFRIRDRLSGNSPVLHVGHGPDMVRMTPLNTANVSAVVRGNVVSFPGAWPNADYVLTLGGHFVRKAIPLRTGHPRMWTFRVDAHSGFDPVALTVGRLRILQPALKPPAGDLTKLAVPLRWFVTQQGGFWVLSVTLPDGDWAGWTVDPTLTLQPGAADGKDARIRNTYPTQNSGVAVNIHAGHYSVDNLIDRTLIQFDLSTIPATATITSAILSVFLTFIGSTFAANDRTAQAYRILQAWVEGTGDDSVSGDGATWNTYDNVSNWQTAGCVGANDVEAAGIGSAAFATTDALGSQHDFDLTAAKVQEWTDGTLANKGMKVQMNTEVSDLYAYGSSDNATAAYRPKLVVTYQLPGGNMGRRALLGVGR